MIYFICIIHLHIFHGNISTHNWPAPNVSGFIAQLVERRTGIREVTGSSPVEVLNFFQASLRNCKNCDHNCEDHSSFEHFQLLLITFLQALTKYIDMESNWPVRTQNTTARIILHLISYPQFTYDLFHMHHSFTYLSREHINPQLTCSQRQWLHSSVGRASHRYSRGHGFKPRWSPEFFFRLLNAIVKIAITTARIILHLISYPQFTYDFFHMHHSFTYLSREHINPQLTCSQRQWLHSSVGRASHRYSRGHGFKPRWSPEFFSGFLTQL